MLVEGARRLQPENSPVLTEVGVVLSLLGTLYYVVVVVICCCCLRLLLSSLWFALTAVNPLFVQGVAAKRIMFQAAMSIDSGTYRHCFCVVSLFGAHAIVSVPRLRDACLCL